MRVWLVTIGEPLPNDPGHPRLLRTGILAAHLAQRGHEVVWWTSTFDHTQKCHRAESDRVVYLAPDYKVNLLRATGYRRNISVARLIDHRILAHKFRRIAREQPQPDVIMCSFPTPELSVEAVRYAASRAKPVVIDIRDFWPDAIIDAIPRRLRGFAGVLTSKMQSEVRFACRGATAITGPSEQFLEWGLTKAGRSRTDLDREFPFGYVREALTPAQERQAELFWDSRNVLRDNDQFNVCFVGTIGHQMELETVVQAATQLDGKYRIRFIICGAGERLEQLREQTLGLNNVLLPGWIDRPQITTLFSRVSVACMPYKARADFEAAIPNKGPEYLSAGLPIALSLGAGAMYDLLQEYRCGFSYHNDASELAAHLIRLYQNPEELRSASRNAQALFDARFRGDVVYSGLADYLESLGAPAGPVAFQGAARVSAQANS